MLSAVASGRGDEAQLHAPPAKAAGQTSETTGGWLGDSRKVECGSSPGVMQRRALQPGAAAQGGASGSAGANNTASSGGKRRWKLFERANSQWWNPQFASVALETCYWKCSFPQLRERFRCGLVYLIISDIAWIAYHLARTDMTLAFPYIIGCALMALGAVFILGFTFSARNYQRFYLPTSFLCMFIVFIISLLIFSLQTKPLFSPVGTFATTVETVVLLYTVIPLPLYVVWECPLVGLLYSLIFAILSAASDQPTEAVVKIVLHIAVHLLGVHIFILNQVRQRKTFLKVGQSLLSRKDLENETAFKDRMIESVMPKSVAMQLLKETTELRRSSVAAERDKRIATAGGEKFIPDPSKPVGTKDAGPSNVFRPFTMNLLSDVSILFADICGFTKMSSNKSADELVNLLNDLFGRFDRICTLIGCEKISTLGDCYYAVSGCPEPRPDHAQCCVDLGLAMIQAIAQFDHDRGQEVNMRVGIHTGKVMCGIVGQARFKFDVFSNDVTLANEMESSGRAGRVHISEATRTFLPDNYVVEPGDPHPGTAMKTYYIKARLRSSTSPDRGTATDTSNKAASVDRSESKRSLTKKLSCRLRAVTTNSYPGNTAGLFGGSSKEGSLRVKLLGPKVRDRDVESAYFVETMDGQRRFEKRKSASEQAICAHLSAATTSPLSAALDNGHSPAAVVTSDGPPATAKVKKLPLSGRISNKTDPGADGTTPGSLPIANGGSSAGTGSLQEAGQLSAVQSTGGAGGGAAAGSGCHRSLSRSSGLAAEAGSEPGSMAALDTVTAHHAAASLTRFDTDHRDFDRRLCDAIQNSSTLENNQYWIPSGALNPFTLCFRDDAIEQEYRKHVPMMQDDNRHNRQSTKVDRAPGTLTVGALATGGSRRVTYRYSAAIVDAFVAALIFLIINILVPAAFPLSDAGLAWALYFVFGLLLTIAALIRVTSTHLKPSLTIARFNSWLLRHVIGLLLIGLPAGAPLVVVWFAPGADINSAYVWHLCCALMFIVAMFAHCNFSQLACWPKTIQCGILGSVFASLALMCASVQTDFCESPLAANDTLPWKWPLFSGIAPYRWEMLVDVLLALILIGFLNYQFEAGFRMAFWGGQQAKQDQERMLSMRDQADWLLYNIIPHHVVEELKSSSKYSESHDSVAVLFASIINWGDMYEETFEGGKEFLRVLNEVIGDFDDLLSRPQFSQVEKIKTIGPCYMAAAGLNPERRRGALHPYEHLYQLMDFALALQEALDAFNEDLLNFDFIMKIGYNIGPVTAGVIGTTKLYYDIWGDTVNIASRMYSTGVARRIQVSDQVRQLLCDRYEFEFRSHIDVKGIDSGMDVYLLTGRKS